MTAIRVVHKSESRSVQARHKTTHRIAVVGAGASGIVCARELKKRGWSQVTVFERLQEAGGKTRSVLVADSMTGRQEPAEQGTYAVLNSPVLREIIEDTGLAGDLVNHRAVKYFNAAHGKASNPLFSTRNQKPFWEKLSELRRYRRETSLAAALQKPGFLGPIDPAYLCSIDEWLTRRDFGFVREALMPLLCTTFCGNGLKDIPAAYLMKYEGIMRRTPIWRRATITLPRIRFGNQEIWKRAARPLDVRYGEPVDRIVREEDEFKLQTRNGISAFDSVIWTTGLPVLDAALEPVSDESNGARRFYSQVRHFKRAVLTYHIEGLPRDIAWIFPDVSLASVVGESYGIKNWPGTDCFMFYPWMTESHSIEDLDRNMRSLVARFGGRVKSFATNPFVIDYHPYFDAKVLQDGAYAALEEEQGRDGLYLCGEIMSGILLPSTTEYSKNLIERFF